MIRERGDELNTLQEVSVENLIHYIRFEAFSETPVLEKKKVLALAFDVPMREDTLFRPIKEAILSNNFQAFVEIIHKNKNKVSSSNIVEKIQGFMKMNSNPVQELFKQTAKTWPIVLEAYFNESDPKLALKLLRHLLFFKITDSEMKSLKMFIANYESAYNETREQMVPAVVWHSFTI